MLVQALAPEDKKVYLLNQDYLFGQSMQHDIKTFLAKLRPDIADRRRRADPARQGQGFLALRQQDQGVRRAGADHRQLGPGPEPADQGRASMPGSTSSTTRSIAPSRRRPTAIGPARRRPRASRSRSFNENIAGRDRQCRARSTGPGSSARPMTSISMPPASAPCSSSCRPAINKAGSTDALKVAQALEGMTSTDMTRARGDHARGRPPAAEPLLRRDVHQGREIRLPRRPASAGRLLTTVEARTWRCRPPAR